MASFFYTLLFAIAFCLCWQNSQRTGDSYFRQPWFQIQSLHCSPAPVMFMQLSIMRKTQASANPWLVWNSSQSNSHSSFHVPGSLRWIRESDEVICLRYPPTFSNIVDVRKISTAEFMVSIFSTDNIPKALLTLCVSESPPGGRLPHLHSQPLCLSYALVFKLKPSLSPFYFVVLPIRATFLHFFSWKKKHFSIASVFPPPTPWWFVYKTLMISPSKLLEKKHLLHFFFKNLESPSLRKTVVAIYTLYENVSLLLVW